MRCEADHAGAEQRLIKCKCSAGISLKRNNVLPNDVAFQHNLGGWSKSLVNSIDRTLLQSFSVSTEIQSNKVALFHIGIQNFAIWNIRHLIFFHTQNLKSRRRDFKIVMNCMILSLQMIRGIQKEINARLPPVFADSVVWDIQILSFRICRIYCPK